jgi:hypothetical protein
MPLNRRRLIFATCTSAAVAVGAVVARTSSLHAQIADPVVWACGESLKVTPDAAPQTATSVWKGEGRNIGLHAARGEYVAFQVVVRAGAQPLESVEVRVPGLQGPGGAELAASNIDLFREHYLRVTVPSQFDNTEPVPEAKAGEQPVQMVPLRSPAPGKSFTIPAGRNQPVWVDVWVPEAQAPGDYRGQVEVLSNGRPLATLNLGLTVWNFTLPRETHLKTYVPTGPENMRWAFGLKPGDDERLLAVQDRFFQMAHQHRLNFQPSEDENLPEWAGRYRKYVDGSGFKERAGVGVGLNLLMVGPPDEELSAISGYARKVVDWWKALPKRPALAFYVLDEPHADEEFATATARAAAVRAAVGKSLPLYLTTTKPERMPPGLIDISVNQGYAAGPYVDTPGYAGRSQAWMAWKLKLDAWHFWDGCYWVDRQNLKDPAGKRYSVSAINADPRRFLTDLWNDPLTFDQKKNPKEKYWIRINGDGVLFYPGSGVGLQEPIAGFTMKSLRRGLQDYEYLWLLAQKGRAVNDVVDRVTPAAGAWSHDPNTWDEARLELGRRLSQ